MATRAELIAKLSHLLMTCRDDLTPESEGRAVWNKVYDILVRADLTISGVTISQIPRTGEQAAEIQAEIGSDEVIPFGKFSGRTVKDVAAQDKGYLRWMLTTNLRSPKLRKAIEEAVK